MCLGHESSGVIARLGSNLAALARKAEEAEKELAGSDKQPAAVVGKGVLKIGTRVTLEPGVTCRMCHDCRGGQYQVSLTTRLGTPPGRCGETSEEAFAVDRR